MSDIDIDNKSQFTISPDNIAVIGGGRWARVLTETICGLVNPSVNISIYSPHNASAMSVSARGLVDVRGVPWYVL